MRVDRRHRSLVEEWAEHATDVITSRKQLMGNLYKDEVGGSILVIALAGILSGTVHTIFE